LTVWVGVGGTPQSVIRAAKHRFPLMLAIIGGDPRRFAPFVDLFHKATSELGFEPQAVGAHSPGHGAATDEDAREQLWPHYAAMMTRIGRERGWRPITRDDFEREAGPDGAIFVGSPDTVAAKISRAILALGLSRFDLKYSNGTLPHRLLLSSIELYGAEVVPRVRETLDRAGYRAPVGAVPS
jgi:alkanesulfonate monooxygenase SsuD/methylene tetrahydromethanopterin reductase-like flavin-dependent oxidoreductase (luciferase family)